MNSDRQNKLIISLSVGNIILVIILLVLSNKYLSYDSEVRMSNKQREMQSTQGIVKDIVYEEVSPDEDHILILYEFLDYPEDREFIAIKSKASKIEQYLYFLDAYKNGIPKWLGNGFIYFTTYCGTSCQGLDLLDINRKQIYHGVLSYMVLDEKRGHYTVFKDWFGQEFTFDGLVDNITSETIKDRTYLILKMENERGQTLGQKRFLFTDKALKEE